MNGFEQRKKNPICVTVADEHITQMHPTAGTYPVFNPETGQWLNMGIGMGMGMGMGMYPYPPQFFPPVAVRPDYFPNAGMPYPFRGGGGGNYRGRFPRGRGRGNYRNRGNYNSYNSNYDNGYDDYDSYDHKRRDYRKRYAQSA